MYPDRRAASCAPASAVERALRDSQPVVHALAADAR
jgi:hypothetical protein